MKKALLIYFLLSTQYMNAQNKLVGARIGASASNITEQRFFDSTVNRIGINFGFTYDYYIKNHFHIGADLLYFENGFDAKTFVLSDNTGMVIKQAYLHYNFNYVAVPLKAGVHYGNKLFGFTNLAVIPSFLLSAKVYAPKFEYPNQIVKHNIRTSTRIYDIAASLETGIGFKPKEKKYQYYISCYIYHSLTPFSTPDFFSTANVWHRGMVLSMGMKYGLGKKDNQAASR